MEIFSQVFPEKIEWDIVYHYTAYEPTASVEDDVHYTVGVIKQEGTD